MNKIKVEDIKNEERQYHICEDTTVFIKNSDLKINYTISKNAKIFQLIESSSVKMTYDIKSNLTLNIFSVNSTLDITTNLNKDNLIFNYAYSAINENNNTYKININHFGKNITSNIVSHGINMENEKLSFTINAIVPKNSDGTITNQDSNILLLGDNNVTIKPNLIVDNFDIEANHSAYIGQFKEEELFYLESRGINKETAKKLLAKSFLIGAMDISFREKDIILEIIKRYWR